MATVVIQKRTRSKGMSYPVYFKDPITGRNKYYKTYRRLREAQDAANELRQLLDAGKIAEVKQSRKRISLMTFEEVCRSLETIWKGRYDRSELSKSSYDGYCERLRLIKKDFGHRILCEISKDELLEYRNKAASKSSNVTANRNLFVLRQVFKRGIDLNSIKKDPAAAIPYLSEKEHMRNEFLTPPQLDKLLKACKSLRAKDALSAIVCLAAEHGASRQEILDLKWSNIDFDFEGKGLIRFFRTKNGRERTEYLMPRTREALLQWREHQEWMRHRKRVEDKGSGFVFSKLDGRRLGGFSRSWRKARELAGFPHLHFHDLRHTFCSNLIMSGSDLKDVKEMIGHSDLSMTDRYAHLTSMRKLSKQEDLARFYASGEATSKHTGKHISHTDGE
jgi:integrase